MAARPIRQNGPPNGGTYANRQGILDGSSRNLLNLLSARLNFHPPPKHKHLIEIGARYADG